MQSWVSNVVSIKLLGGLQYYTKRANIDLAIASPMKLRQVLDELLLLFDEPAKKLLVSNGKLRAIVIVNGVAETNYDKTIENKDQLILTSEIEGG